MKQSYTIMLAIGLYIFRIARVLSSISTLPRNLSYVHQVPIEQIDYAD